MLNNMPNGTEAVFRHLKKCASDMRTDSYGEIADAAGLPTPLQVFGPLDYIRDKVCRHRGLPWLSAIAVNKDTRRPGHGFLPGNFVIGDEEDDLPRFWRGMVLQVFATDWSNVNLANPN